ncbi:MAG: hypothetical protein NTZ05_00300 [Chloroflexi bacterium]|nr:hypothetical protein [Chloroflexota bacterium]
MRTGFAALGLQRSVLVVETEDQRDPALAGALAHWGCSVTSVTDSMQALRRLAHQPPTLLVAPDGGSAVSGTYLVTVTARGLDVVWDAERPRDAVLQRPVDPTEVELLLVALFGDAVDGNTETGADRSAGRGLQSVAA